MALQSKWVQNGRPATKNAAGQGAPLFNVMLSKHEGGVIFHVFSFQHQKTQL
jgi:hypothetical protein